MKKIKRYIGVIALIITISLMLIGCGQVKINSEVSISIDGTSSTRLKIYYDDTINKLVDNDLLSKVISKINNSIPSEVHFGDIVKSKEENLNVEEVEIKTDKVKIDELDNLSNDYFTVKEVKNKGFITNKYIITIKLKHSVTDIISNYINSSINNNIGLNLGNLINKNMANLIGNIPVNLSISMPVKITDTNSNEIVNGKIIKYSYTINDLNESNSIVMGFNVPNIQNIIFIIVIIVIAIFGLLIYSKKRKRKK